MGVRPDPGRSLAREESPSPKRSLLVFSAGLASTPATSDLRMGGRQRDTSARTSKTLLDATFPRKGFLDPPHRHMPSAPRGAADSETPQVDGPWRFDSGPNP